MSDTRKLFDPFLEMEVEISDKLTDRLRGKYAIGPIGPDGVPEFGWRQHGVPPIQIEAAGAIDRLRAALIDAKAALYNGFEPDNQSLAYKRVVAALIRDGGDA